MPVMRAVFMFRSIESLARFPVGRGALAWTSGSSPEAAGDDSVARLSFSARQSLIEERIGQY